jgi:hypothetical protein
MLRTLAIALAALALTTTATADACCIRVQRYPPGYKHATEPPPLAIGDSVMIAAARRLARAGFEVDAREGRFMRSALRILRPRRRLHRQPRVVVVALGTNAPATYAEIRKALRLLGHGRKRRRLAMVIPRRSWRSLGGGPIYAAKRNHPRRIKILDWASVSAAHPEWFWGDGTHLRPAGAAAYTRLLARALP